MLCNVSAMVEEALKQAVMMDILGVEGIEGVEEVVRIIIWV